MHTFSPVAFKASEASFVKSKITPEIQLPLLFFPRKQKIPLPSPSLEKLSPCTPLYLIARPVSPSARNPANRLESSGQTFNQSEPGVSCFVPLCIKSGKGTRCQYHLNKEGNSHFKF
jgi:hypothetical protein